MSKYKIENADFLEDTLVVDADTYEEAAEKFANHADEWKDLTDSGIPTIVDITDEGGTTKRFKVWAQVSYHLKGVDNIGDIT